MPSKKNAQPISKLIFKYSLTILIGYLIFNMLVGFYFVLLPVINRSTDNFASLIINSARTWEKASPLQKHRLTQQLMSTDNIVFNAQLKSVNTPPSPRFLPYLYLLKKKLNSHPNTSAQINYYPNEVFQYVITLHRKQPLTIYFKQEKIGTSPPFVILSVFISSILISILASYLLARRLDKYFQPLIKASITLSKGETPQLIEETGPSEIQLLSKSFNNMSRNVQQLLQNRTTLLAGVSHNLRTPVTRIKLALELLPESTDAELKNKIDRSLNEIDTTIEQFLNMAEGMNTLAPQSISLNSVIKESIAKFDHHSTDIVFNPQFEITCELSVSALEQILLNLIENSLRYGEDTPINITTLQIDGGIQIQVIDSGPGIPDEIKDAIFQPFVSQGPIQSEIPGGTGLGLAICQIICKAHQWELTIGSAPSTSTGTCASLLLPTSPA